MLSVKEKSQIPEQSFIQEHLRLLGITRTMEKITTFGIEMSTETTQTRISL